MTDTLGGVEYDDQQDWSEAVKAYAASPTVLYQSRNYPPNTTALFCFRDGTQVGEFTATKTDADDNKWVTDVAVMSAIAAQADEAWMVAATTTTRLDRQRRPISMGDGHIVCHFPDRAWTFWTVDGPEPHDAGSGRVPQAVEIGWGVGQHIRHMAQRTDLSFEAVAYAIIGGARDE